ncbi:MAG: hypothetical protein AAF333_16440 [Planctomycetota bacterium]
MNALVREVATLALEQSRDALRSITVDMKPYAREKLITAAVRALTAWQQAHDPDPVHPEQEEAESPA